MEMIWFNPQSKDVDPFFFSNFSDDSIKSFFNFVDQHRSSPLGTPDKMVVYEIDLISRMFILHIIYSIAQIDKAIKA
jgi:hypothetical protein